MTNTEKVEFLKQLFASELQAMKNVMDRIPDSWNGHELRVWAARRLSESAAATVLVRAPRSPRRRNFENVILTKCL